MLQSFVIKLKQDPDVRDKHKFSCNLFMNFIFLFTQNVDLQKEINKAEQEIILIGIAQVSTIYIDNL